VHHSVLRARSLHSSTASPCAHISHSLDLPDTASLPLLSHRVRASMGCALCVTVCQTRLRVTLSSKHTPTVSPSGMHTRTLAPLPHPAPYLVPSPGYQFAVLARTPPSKLVSERLRDSFLLWLRTRSFRHIGFPHRRRSWLCWPGLPSSTQLQHHNHCLTIKARTNDRQEPW